MGSPAPLELRERVGRRGASGRCGPLGRSSPKVTGALMAPSSQKEANAFAGAHEAAEAHRVVGAQRFDAVGRVWWGSCLEVSSCGEASLFRDGAMMVGARRLGLRVRRPIYLPRATCVVAKLGIATAQRAVLADHSAATNHGVLKPPRTMRISLAIG